MERRYEKDLEGDDVNISNIYVRVCRWVYPQGYTERPAFMLVEVWGIIDGLVCIYWDIGRDRIMIEFRCCEFNIRA